MQRTFYPFDERWAMPVRLPVSQAMECDGLVFTCGQVDLDPDGNPLNAGDLEAQAGACLAHVERTLARAAIGWTGVLHLQVYYRSDAGDAVDESALARWIAARLPSDAAPALTLVPLPAFYYAGVAIEIDAIAAKNEVIAWAGRPGFGRYASGAGLVFASERAAAVDGPLDGQIAASAEALLGALDEAGIGPGRVAKLTAWFDAGAAAAEIEAAIGRLGDAFARERPALVPVTVPALYPAGQRVRLSAIAAAPGEGELSRGSATRLPGGLLADWPAWTRRGNRVFVGACFAEAPDGVPDDIEAQTRIAMSRLGAALGSAGGAFQDLVEMNTHFVGAEGDDAFHRNLMIRAGHFQPPACPSTGVNVPALWPGDALIVVDGMAVLNDPPAVRASAPEFTEYSR